MIELFIAILSPIAYSFNNIFVKKLSKKINSQTSLILVYSNLSLILGIIAFFLGDFSHKFNLELIFYILIIGFFGALGIWALFESFKKLPISKTLAIANLYPFITLIILYLLGIENFTIEKVILLIIISFGISLVLNFDFKNKKNIKFNKNLIYPIITMVCWGIFFSILNKFVVLNINPINTIFYSEFSIFLFILIYFSIFKSKEFEFNKINSKIIFNSFLGGISAGVGGLSIIYAILFGLSGTIASSIASIQIIFSSIFAYLFFKEKLNLKQILGIIIITISLVLYQIF